MSRPAYTGETLSHVALMRRREEIRARHKRAVEQVNALYASQATIAEELGDGLAQMQKHGSELDRLTEEENASGLLAALMRPFTARRVALARKSVTEALLTQYEAVSIRLREATAFSDDLKLCALEMQDEVDRLHRDHAAATHNAKLAAERVLELEKELARLEAEPSSPERARTIDRLTFELRTESINLELFRANAEQCAHHLGPARKLRDAVLELHEDMARYVLTATQAVNAAGRRIQGLGMMADAPIVVAELQASIEELNEAMEATAAYVEQNRDLIARVLPELTQQLETEAALDATETMDTLEEVSRERARQLAEQALREAARAEIEAFLDGDA